MFHIFRDWCLYVVWRPTLPNIRRPNVQLSRHLSLPTDVGLCQRKVYHTHAYGAAIHQRLRLVQGSYDPSGWHNHCVTQGLTGESEQVWCGVTVLSSPRIPDNEGKLHHHCVVWHRCASSVGWQWFHRDTRTEKLQGKSLWTVRQFQRQFKRRFCAEKRQACFVGSWVWGELVAGSQESRMRKSTLPPRRLDGFKMLQPFKGLLASPQALLANQEAVCKLSQKGEAQRFLLVLYRWRVSVLWETMWMRGSDGLCASVQTRRRHSELGQKKYLW